MALSQRQRQLNHPVFPLDRLQLLLEGLSVYAGASLSQEVMGTSLTTGTLKTVRIETTIERHQVVLEVEDFHVWLRQIRT